MKSCNVKISEPLRRTVTVEANDYDEAIDKVRNARRKSEYVLKADDFLEAGFELVSVKYS